MSRTATVAIVTAFIALAAWIMPAQVPANAASSRVPSCELPPEKPIVEKGPPALTNTNRAATYFISKTTHVVNGQLYDVHIVNADGVEYAYVSPFGAQPTTKVAIEGTTPATPIPTTDHPPSWEIFEQLPFDRPREYTGE